MATNVIFDDYVNNRRSSLFFVEKDFNQVIERWQKVDQVLVNLHDIPMFQNVERWEQLNQLQFRILITNALNRRDIDVPVESHFDESNLSIATLYFLIKGLIYSVQQKTEGTVDTLNMIRISDVQVNFRFTLSMIPTVKPEPKPQNGLRIIVDNTDGTS